MEKNKPTIIKPGDNPINFFSDESLVLALDLKSRAKLTPHMNGREQTLSVMNKGPDEDLKIERNGNLIVITQPEFSTFINGPRPDIEIFVPHKFQRLTLNVSGHAEVSGSAFPHATVIETAEYSSVIFKCHDCFAHITEGTEVELTVKSSERVSDGKNVRTLHDLVLISEGGYIQTDGEIDKAYMLFARKITGRNLATINKMNLFVPIGQNSYEFLAQTGLMRSVREKGLSMRGQQRKAAQMWRGFNACVRSKALARLEAEPTG